MIALDGGLAPKGDRRLVMCYILSISLVSRPRYENVLKKILRILANENLI